MKHALHAAGWVLVGMILMGVLVWFSMPSMMLIKHKSGRSYDETVALLSEAIKSQKGWRVLNVNDYQQSTAAFANLERAGSLTICNPRYASRILANDADRGVTAFMPLGIGVYEDKKGQVYVSQLNVSLLGMMFGGTIADVMGSAGRDIDTAVARGPAEPARTRSSAGCVRFRNGFGGALGTQRRRSARSTREQASLPLPTRD